MLFYSRVSSRAEGGAPLCRDILPASPPPSAPNGTCRSKLWLSGPPHTVHQPICTNVPSIYPHTQPSQAGTAFPSAQWQMRWPGLLTICFPAGGGAKYSAEFQAELHRRNPLLLLTEDFSPLLFGCQVPKSGLMHLDFVRRRVSQVKRKAGLVTETRSLTLVQRVK